MNQPVASLNLPSYIINKLQKSGVYYCDDLKENFDEFKEKMGIPDWSSLIQAPPTKTALELFKEECQWKPPTSYIPELNVLLKNQIAPGLITEITGFPGSGKTQVCFHLAVGASTVGETFFISTNNSFATHRLREIAQQYCSDVDLILKRIYCLEVTDSEELLASIYFLESWLKDHNQMHLLIIDNIAWPLRQKQCTERPSIFYTFFQNIRTLSNQYKFGIVIVNDQTTKIAGENTYYTSSFGESFFHAVNNRIILSKENNFFKAQILKSVVVNQCEEVTFKL